MKRLESPPSGYFRFVARIPVAPPNDPPPYCFEDNTNAINIDIQWQFHTFDEIIF